MLTYTCTLILSYLQLVGKPFGMPCAAVLVINIGLKFGSKVGNAFVLQTLLQGSLEEHAFRVNSKAGAICIDFGVLLVSTWALFLSFICSFSWQFSGSASAWLSIPFLRVQCWSLQHLPGRLPPLCKRRSLDVWVLDTSSRQKQ